MIFQEFMGSSYTLDSVNADLQRLVNMYFEANETQQGKNRSLGRLVSRPGLRLKEAVGSGPIRGQWTTEKRDRNFAVSGNTLYERYADGTAAASRGTLSASSGQVFMCDNGLQVLVIEPNVAGWIFTFADNTFVQITDEDFPNPGWGLFQDGYFIVGQYNSPNVYVSTLYDGTQWDALDFGTKEGRPDPVVVGVSDHRELWLLGKGSGEVWYNSGNADFPFQRMDNAFLEHGIGDAGTVQKMDNSVFFGQADDKGSCQVVRAEGYSTKRISTHAIEQLIEGWGGFSGCSSFTYQHKGHSFYVLNFTQGTIAFDAATGLWHELSYTPTDGTGETRYRGNNHSYFGGLHLIGDYANGNIYYLDHSYFYDGSANITCRRRAPHISNENKRLFFGLFELDAETGVGNSNVVDGAGNLRAPEVMLRWSNDQGKTWSDERWRSLGKIGEYKTRVRWNRCGSARDRVFEVMFTDPCKFAIQGAFVEVEAGNA